jgi:hypothetical protein
VKPADISRIKNMKYLKDKINELATNSKNKHIKHLYRGISEFKRGYQPRNNLMKDEKGDLLTDSHNILNSWKIYFSQLLKVHNVSDVRQIAVHTAEPLVPGPCHLCILTREFVCSIWFTHQTAIVSLHSINWLLFVVEM